MVKRKPKPEPEPAVKQEHHMCRCCGNCGSYKKAVDGHVIGHCLTRNQPAPNKIMMVECDEFVERWAM